MILTWKTTPSHLWYSDASDERRLIESLLSLIFIVLDKIMNKFLWLKIVLIMYINIKGDECKNHVIVNCILPLLTLCQCIFALVWAAFIEKFKKKIKARLLSFLSGLPFKNKNPTGTKKNNISIGIWKFLSE